MKTHLGKLFILILTLACHNLVAQIGGAIPSNRRVDWTHVGVKNFPSTYDVCVDVTQHPDYPLSTGGGEDSPNFKRQLDERDKNKITVFYFPPGTYNFSSTIVLDSNVIIYGAGSDQTSFIFTNSNPNKNCIQVHGSGFGSPVDINATSAVKGSKIILLNSALSINKNDLIDIYATDDYPDWSSTGFNLHDKIGQIDRVASGNSGNTGSISLEEELRLDYTYDYVNLTSSSFPVKIAKIIKPAHAVGIENIKLTHSSSDMSAMDYMISFQYAVAAEEVVNRKINRQIE